MVLKRLANLSFVAFAAAGIALLVAGFLLVVPEEKRTPVAWLDLIVVGAVFLVNFSNLSIVRFKHGGFSEEIPKLGVLWTADAIYTTLALGGIWFGRVLGLSFGIQLWYHSAICFALLVMVWVGNRASDHASRVASGEKSLRSSLDSVKTAVETCDSAFARLGPRWTSEYNELQRVKEDVRYLSPCDNPEAVALDLEISAVLRGISANLATANPSGANGREVHEPLTRCQSLIRLRKQQRQT
jgi:hypothetical protein